MESQGESKHMAYECAKLQFNYWPKDCYQVDQKRTFKRRFHPVNAITQGQPVEFYIPGAPHLYNEMGQSHFEIKARIVAEDGTPIAGGVVVSTCNLTAHSMFGDILVEVGG